MTSKYTSAQLAALTGVNMTSIEASPEFQPYEGMPIEEAYYRFNAACLQHYGLPLTPDRTAFLRRLAAICFPTGMTMLRKRNPDAFGIIAGRRFCATYRSLAIDMYPAECPVREIDCTASFDFSKAP